MVYDVVGMISKNKSRDLFQTHVLTPMLACHVKEVHGFQIMYAGSHSGLVANHMGVKKALRGMVGKRADGVPDSFQDISLAGPDGPMHVLRVSAHVCCPSIPNAQGRVVWCTQSVPEPKEHWLVGADVDLSTFLACYFGTSAAISYWAYIRFSPFIEGKALCGTRLITFSKVQA